MTQTNSAIMVAIELSMEYAKPCMSMRLGQQRPLSGCPPGQATDEDAWHASVNRMRALTPARVHFCHHTDVVHG